MRTGFSQKLVKIMLFGPNMLYPLVDEKHCIFSLFLQHFWLVQRRAERETRTVAPPKSPSLESEARPDVLGAASGKQGWALLGTGIKCGGVF